MKTRIFRTSGFRLAAIYAGFFAISTGLLFAIVFWIASDVLREQARSTLTGEMRELTNFSEPTDSARLISEIAHRVAVTPVHDLYYGLHGDDGRLIAGDLPAFPTHEGWQNLSAPNPLADKHIADAPDDPETNFLAVARRLTDGRTLAVAIDTFKIDEAQEAIARAFAWAAGVGIVLALFGGLLVSRAFLKQIDTVNRAFEVLLTGSMDRRLPTALADDELGRLAENFNNVLDRLQASMNDLKQVSDAIAHDLRTPLSRLRQSLEGAVSEARSLRDYETAVEGAIADTDAILATFAGLLRIAQIEAGSRKAAFQDLNLSEVFQPVVDSFAPVAEDQDKTLVGDIRDDLHFHGDSELLTQMAVNLIANALNHTPPGTNISVTLEDGSTGPCCTIADNGPGIPTEKREDVFRRFFRLDQSRTTQGSGLGLALVSAIAKLHAINITLGDNKPGLRIELHFSK